MDIDALVVTLSLDPTGFQRGADLADDAGKKLKESAVASAEAAHKAAEESAAAALTAAKAQQDYAKATGDAARDAAKQQAEAAQAEAAVSALLAQQKRKDAQDQAALLAKRVKDAQAAADAVERAEKAEADAAKKAAKDRADADKKAQDARDKANKEQAKANKDAADQVNKLKNEVLALFGAYEAGKGLLSFVNSTNQAEMAAGRLAARVGVSTREISAQENAAQLLGAKLGDVGASYESIAQKRADWLIRGNLVNAEIRQISAGIGGVQDVNYGDDAAKVREALLHNTHLVAQARGGQYAQDYGKKAGLSQGDIDNAIKYTDAARAQADAQGRLNALNDKDIAAADARNRAAAELSQTFDRLSETLLTNVTPAIVEVERQLEDLLKSPGADKFAKFLGSEEFKKDVKEFEADSVAVAGAVKDVAVEVNAAVNSMGGWKIVLESLIALKVVGWLWGIAAPLRGMIGLLFRGAGAWRAMRAATIAARAAAVAAAAAETEVGVAATAAAAQTAVAGKGILGTFSAIGRGALALVASVTALSTALLGAIAAAGELYAYQNRDKSVGQNTQDFANSPVGTAVSGIIPGGNWFAGIGLAVQSRIMRSVFGKTDEGQKEDTAKGAAAGATANGSSGGTKEGTPPVAAKPIAASHEQEPPVATEPEDLPAPVIELGEIAPILREQTTILGHVANFISSILDIMRGWVGMAAGDTGQPGAAPSAPRAGQAPGATQGAPRGPSGGRSSATAPSDPAIEAVPPEGVVRSYGGNWEIRHNNFAGQRIPGVNAGPNSGGFKSFATPEDGVRSVAHLLKVYQDKHGLNTLEGIINRWAPPTDKNDTAGLIKRASQVTGFGANQKIDLHDTATMEKVVEAMIRGEQGGKLPVPKEIIHAALSGQAAAAKDAPKLVEAAVKEQAQRPGMNVPLSERTASIVVPGNAAPHPVAGAKPGTLGDFEARAEKAVLAVAKAIHTGFSDFNKVLGPHKAARHPGPSIVVAASKAGAATMAARAGTHSIDNSRSVSSTTHIDQVHLHADTPDPAGHAATFNKHIGQYAYANDANTSVL